MIAAEMAAIAPGDLDKLVLIARGGPLARRAPDPRHLRAAPRASSSSCSSTIRREARRCSPAALDFSDMEALKEFYLGQQRRLAMAGKILFPIPNRRLSKRLYRLDRRDAGPLGRRGPADRRRSMPSAGASSSRARRARSSRRRAHAAVRAAGRVRLRGLAVPRMSEPQGDGWIGRPLKRREDHRLLIGAGRFVDDMTPPGCLHVALLRSPHAHARIARLDVERARGAPRRRRGGHRRGREPSRPHAGEPRWCPTCACRRIRSSPRARSTRRHAGGRGGGRERQRGVGRARSDRRRLRAPARPAEPGGARWRPAHRCCSPASKATARSRASAGRRRSTRLRGRGPRRVAARGAEPRSPRWRWSRARSWPPSTRTEELTHLGVLPGAVPHPRRDRAPARAWRSRACA